MGANYFFVSKSGGPEAAGGLYSYCARDSQEPCMKISGSISRGLQVGAIRELPEDVWETGEERREVRMVTDISWLEGKGNWKDLKTIIQYRCYREETGSGTGKWTERYYSSSGDTSAGELYRNIRGHWSIKNRLHWSLDMVFREEAARVRCGYGPDNLIILRKIALSLLRAVPNPRVKGKKSMSGPKKRFTAAMNPDYMFTVVIVASLEVQISQGFVNLYIIQP
jgi:predicted transposase YbfD/YdcC